MRREWRKGKRLRVKWKGRRGRRKALKGGRNCEKETCEVERVVGNGK
jgi:hypothetical protein